MKESVIVIMMVVTVFPGDAPVVPAGEAGVPSSG